MHTRDSAGKNQQSAESRNYIIVLHGGTWQMFIATVFYQRRNDVAPFFSVLFIFRVGCKCELTTIIGRHYELACRVISPRAMIFVRWRPIHVAQNRKKRVPRVLGRNRRGRGLRKCRKTRWVYQENSVRKRYGPEKRFARTTPTRQAREDGRTGPRHPQAPARHNRIRGHNRLCSDCPKRSRHKS